MLAFWYALGVRATLLLFCALGMGVFMGNLQWGFVRTQPCQGQEPAMGVCSYTALPGAGTCGDAPC
jgi:hypothetical protein